MISFWFLHVVITTRKSYNASNICYDTRSLQCKKYHLFMGITQFFSPICSLLISPKVSQFMVVWFMQKIFKTCAIKTFRSSKMPAIYLVFIPLLIMCLEMGFVKSYIWNNIGSNWRSNFISISLAFYGGSEECKSKMDLARRFCNYLTIIGVCPVKCPIH